MATRYLPRAIISSGVIAAASSAGCCGAAHWIMNRITAVTARIAATDANLFDVGFMRRVWE
jgi:glycerol dehydrogenase-like iron-containing ADH family enzyme